MSGKIFLKYGDLKGDVKEIGHKDWIELDSCEFTASRSVTHENGNSRRNLGFTSISTMDITKKLELSSQQIFTEAVAGSGKKCVIHFVHAGDNYKTYMEYTLENAVISKYHLSNTGGTSEPTEHIQISFTSITSVYTPYDSTGKTGSPRSAGYDLSQAKKI